MSILRTPFVFSKMKGVLFFMGLLLLSTSISLYAFPFKHMSSATYSSLHRQFPGSEITDISTFDMARIDSKYIPRLWPSRIPFIAGVSHKNGKAFYYQYKTFGYSKLHYIDTYSSHINDIAISSRGHIFVLSEDKGLLVYLFDLIKNSLTSVKQIPMKRGTQLSSNHVNRLAVIQNDSITIYKYKHHSLYPLKTLSKRINRTFNNDQPLFVNVTRRGTIAVISTQSLSFFSSTGRLLHRYPNTANLSYVDSTIDSDYIFGSSQHNTLYKYSVSGNYIFDHENNEYGKMSLDCVIYKAYGNMTLFNRNEGHYFTMKTDVKNLKATLNQKSQLKLQFTLYFPSDVSITLLDSNKENPIELLSKQLQSNTIDLQFENIDPKYRDGSIHIEAKGVYSNANTVKKSISLVVES